MVIAENDLGNSLLQAGRWADAHAAFLSALQQEENPDALFGVACAALWQGDVNTSIDYSQRAYAAFRDQGRMNDAAFAALYTGIAYRCYLGNEAAGFGWLARGETAASMAPDATPVQGWLWSYRSYLLMDQDTRLSEEYARKSLAHSQVTADYDLELVATSSLGVILAKSGRSEEGLPMIDEAMAAISAGDFDRLDTVVIVCCNMLVACELGADVHRAKQWCQIADHYHHRFGCPFMYADCRAIYGRLLLALGDWEAAERELTAAVRLTRDAFPAVQFKAASSLAMLRLRQGRIEEAEALVSGLEHEVEPATAMAEIRLARHQPELAVHLLQRVLRHQDTRNIGAVRACEMLVEAHLLTGNLDSAKDAVATLEATCHDQASNELEARSHAAAGRLALARDDTETAMAQFEAAIATFARLGLVYEAAQAHFALAEAATAISIDLAVTEAEQAQAAFLSLGAQPAADTASAFLRSLGAPTRPGSRSIGVLTSREQEVLALIAGGLSNPEIAERLVISRKTVSHHVSSLLSKLGVRNRAEAVAHASRQVVDA